MAHIWSPDTCKGGICRLEIVGGHEGLAAVRQLCSHHRAIRAGLASDDELFAVVLNTNRAKNAAVKAIAMEYGTREEPNAEFGRKVVQNMPTAAVPWRIDDDDSIVIAEENAGRRARALATLDQVLRSRVKFE